MGGWTYTPCQPLRCASCREKGARHRQQQLQGQTGNTTATTPGSLKELKEMWKQYMRTSLTDQPLAHEHLPGGKPKTGAWAHERCELTKR